MELLSKILTCDRTPQDLGALEMDTSKKAAMKSTTVPGIPAGPRDPRGPGGPCTTPFTGLGFPGGPAGPGGPIAPGAPLGPGAPGNPCGPPKVLCAALCGYHSIFVGSVLGTVPPARRINVFMVSSSLYRVCLASGMKTDVKLIKIMISRTDQTKYRIKLAFHRPNLFSRITRIQHRTFFEFLGKCHENETVKNE